jgi:hypothetical protein
MNHFQLSASHPTNCVKLLRRLIGKKLLGFRASKASNHINSQRVMRSTKTVNDGKMAKAIRQRARREMHNTEDGL